MFGTKHTRILSSTASLLAVTDGRDVIYLSKHSTTEPKRVPCGQRQRSGWHCCALENLAKYLQNIFFLI